MIDSFRHLIGFYIREAPAWSLYDWIWMLILHLLFVGLFIGLPVSALLRGGSGSGQSKGGNHVPEADEWENNRTRFMLSYMGGDPTPPYRPPVDPPE